MKINEISQPKQIDEGIGSALIGDRAAAAIRGFFTGKGTKETQYQQAFLKDFYQDAITSLDNGIRGGFINKDLRSEAPGGAGGGGGTGGTEVDPSATPAPGAAAATATKAQQQTNQTLNNYIKQAAQTINSTTDKNQKIAITKELVNAMADRKDYPEWENALATVQQVIKRGNLDPGFATTAINNLKAGTTMTEAYNIYYINKLVESVGLTWKDLGLSVLKEGKNYYIAETRYVKLNQLFESVISLTENQGVSVGKYMTDWFAAYMAGTKWQNYKAQVEPMIQAIEDSYPKGHKDAIKQLAKTALAISKLSPRKPEGAPDIPAGSEQTGNTKPDPLSNLFQKEPNPEQLKAGLASLPKAERDKIIQDVQKATT